MTIDDNISSMSLRDLLNEWPSQSDMTNAESNAIYKFVEYVEQQGIKGFGYPSKIKMPGIVKKKWRCLNCGPTRGVYTKEV